MKAIYTLALLFTLISLSQCISFDFIGYVLSAVLRADILDIIDCILHNQIIIKDINVIIDGIIEAIRTKDFNKIITALISVAMGLVDEIKKCINNPPPRPGF